MDDGPSRRVEHEEEVVMTCDDIPASGFTIKVRRPEGPGWRWCDTNVCPTRGRIFWTWRRRRQHVPGILKPPR